jgi:oligopeptide/dipeptide ABC transporter ATP-binding protein
MPEGGDDLLRADHLRKTFRSRRGLFRPPAETQAVDDVSLRLAPGEILGVVGESGCGKSTLARIIVGLERADGGSLAIAGRTVFADGAPGLPSAQRGVQMVFQDPYGSLNPRMRARDILAEGLRIRGGMTRSEIDDKVAEHLELVGLDPSAARKYPHQFSGGQRQRLCIARAVITKPKLFIADEAASALDVSVQMQILNLLLDLRERIGLGILFISHDMGVIEYLCDQIAVMYRGRIVEAGPAQAVLDQARHPYTHALMAARPRVGVRRSALRVESGDMQEQVAGWKASCAYAGRCKHAREDCRSATPELVRTGDQSVACFHPLEPAAPAPPVSAAATR